MSVTDVDGAGGSNVVAYDASSVVSPATVVAVVGSVGADVATVASGVVADVVADSATPAADVASTVTAIVTDSSVSGKLLQVVLDSIAKKPESGTEAIALLDYIYHKDIMPLLSKLRTWALAELAKEEAVLAQAAWNEVKAVEAKMAGCCVPRK